jgi:tRNA nucleotidyltransferase/poly(A) polymerase
MNTYYEEAYEIGKKINSTGHWAYFVGGCVRDLYMNRQPKDYDIVTSMLPEDIQKLFPDNKPVGAKFGVILVKTPSGFLVEVATCREDGAYTDGRRPEEVMFTSDVLDDLTRRDFTMNAMVYAPWTDAPFVRDPFHGAEDIKLRQIRTVGPAEQRFEEDALRMMRAARFAAQLGLELHPDTFKGIQQCKQLIRNVSVERIREELFKIFASSQAPRGMNILLHSGLMHECLHWLTWGPWRAERALGLIPAASNTPTLSLSVLLYWVQDNVQRQTGVLNQLKLSNEQKEQCEANIRCRRLTFFHSQSRADQIRAARKKTFKEEVICFSVTQKELGRDAEVDRLRMAIAPLLVELNSAPLLTGDDLITIGYQPSPKFKEVLYLLETEQLNNNITNRDQAEKMVKEYMA